MRDNHFHMIFTKHLLVRTFIFWRLKTISCMNISEENENEKEYDLIFDTCVYYILCRFFNSSNT